MSLASEALAIVPATVIFTECLLRCPLLAIARSASEVAAKSLRVVSSRRISEHWKEVVLPRYSRMLFVRSCLVFLWLTACVGVFMIVFGVTKFLLDDEFTLIAAVPSVLSMAVASVLGVFYGVARAKHGHKQLLAL